MVKIRLRREGTKDRPYYKIVVADSRARKEGPYIEVVGSYDPMKDGEGNYSVDLEKVDSWLGKGAKPSDTVNSLIRKARATAAKS
ncbi:MAG: 30S ribosomal protein S16 [Verrucomicrobiae bacterium]|nr:30S ribosomal protein S16 [Verrucomicrobiae bacterium]